MTGLEAVMVRVSGFLLIALLSGMLSSALLQSNAQLTEAKPFSNGNSSACSWPTVG